MYFFCTYFAGCDREWSEVQLSKAKIVLTGKYCRLSTSQKSFSTVFPWTLGRIVVIQGEDSSSGQTGFTRRKACRDLPQQWPGMYQGYQRLSPLCLIRFPQHISKALNGVVSLSWGVNELNLPWHPCCPDNPPSTMELLMKRTKFENVASGWQWMLLQKKLLETCLRRKMFCRVSAIKWRIWLGKQPNISPAYISPAFHQLFDFIVLKIILSLPLSLSAQCIHLLFPIHYLLIFLSLFPHTINIITIKIINSQMSKLQSGWPDAKWCPQAWIFVPNNQYLDGWTRFTEMTIRIVIASSPQKMFSLLVPTNSWLQVRTYRLPNLCPFLI